MGNPPRAVGLSVIWLTVPLFALMSPILRTLSELSIPFWISETLMAVAVLSALCLAAGGVLVFMYKPVGGSARIYQIVQLLIVTVVVVVALDLALEGRRLVDIVWDMFALSYGKGVLVLADRVVYLIYTVASVLSLAVVFLALWLIRLHVGIILFTTFGTMFAASIATNALVLWNEQEAPDRSEVVDLKRPPAVVHIILDEMIGTEGIDRSIPGGEETYKAIREFHQRFGFRLYGKTFSRHNDTARSIGNLLNFDFSDNESLVGESKYFRSGTQDAYERLQFFDQMDAQDYRIIVYQTKHLNFCRAGITVLCNTFESFNPFNVHMPDEASITVGDLFGELARVYTRNSLLYQVARPVVRKVIGRQERQEMLSGRSDVPGFVSWFDTFTADVLSAGRGHYFFAHIFVPHHPFLLDENCVIQEEHFASNVSIWARENRLDGQNISGERRDFYQHYYKQIGCVYRKLTEFMVALEGVAIFDDATIIVQGDHGSRIGWKAYWEQQSDRDVVDHYSTHFAVRGPSFERGYDLHLVSIQRLFAERFSSEPPGPTADGAESIAAPSEVAGQLIITEMVDFGMASQE